MHRWGEVWRRGVAPNFTNHHHRCSVFARVIQIPAYALHASRASMTLCPRSTSIWLHHIGLISAISDSHADWCQMHPCSLYWKRRERRVVRNSDGAEPYNFTYSASSSKGYSALYIIDINHSLHYYLLPLVRCAATTVSACHTSDLGECIKSRTVYRVWGAWGTQHFCRVITLPNVDRF